MQSILSQFPADWAVTQAVLELVVAEDKKHRFEIEERDGGQCFMRASQGHSFPEGVINSEAMCTRLNRDALLSYPACCHGTYQRFWPAIQAAGGLSRMLRQHIHMSTHEFGSAEVISGMRHNVDMVIYIDLIDAADAGIPFYLSANKVVLSPGNADGLIPSQYFSKVVALGPPPHRLRTDLPLPPPSASQAVSSDDAAAAAAAGQDVP